jgi:hypothetical protein
MRRCRKQCSDNAGLFAESTRKNHPGGTIYIVGAGILDDSRLSPPPAVFWNMTFINLYHAGAAYTAAEHTAWLSAAGCERVERITPPTGSGIILVRRRVEPGGDGGRVRR